MIKSMDRLAKSQGQKIVETVIFSRRETSRFSSKKTIKFYGEIGLKPRPKNC